jgi:2-polyprenyl-3-methyl-5-hydroxy-6-metoxy-1,4-benzoquinol methylase
MVLSPLTNGPTRLVDKISTARVIEEYHRQLKIDVSSYFSNLPFISIHECIETGYRFYYPLTLAGRADLYEQLESSEWTHKENKWEFLAALAHIEKNAKILDVGCGEGAFIQLCKNRETPAAGLELNPLAASIARSKGRDVRVERLDDHARSNIAGYDAVTSFQVLEHISNPKDFLSSCAALLRDGGILVIGVPNNGAFLRHAKNLILNMPPHHMGLWTSESLRAIQDFFPLELVHLQEEPLVEIDWFAAVQVQRFLRTALLQRIYYRLKVDRLFRKLLERLAPRIHGHTILAVYKKVRLP